MATDTLKQLFDFLKDNRIYNKEVQQVFYKSVILPYQSPNDKIISLLYHVVNTQSQPKIDKLAIFYKKIQTNYEHLSTFRDFANVLNLNKINISPTYFDVFNSLHNSSGWGKKTAALLVKSLYHLHYGEYGEDLRIWSDAPLFINNNELFYLPVDTVILFIFEKLKIDCRYDFDGINRHLHQSNIYQGDLMEIWDDLWFWGFITQKGGGDNRIMEWNENKYWSLLETNKSFKQIEKIESLANSFIQIIETASNNNL